ncbi:MAG TPA: hypothetical protein VHR72_06495, partial [Gemmataceae bacterium]|nr:hypothetical protein [Gemmataceae bacterium]
MDATASSIPFDGFERTLGLVYDRSLAGSTILALGLNLSQGWLLPIAVSSGATERLDQGDISGTLLRQAGGVGRSRFSAGLGGTAAVSETQH